VFVYVSKCKCCIFVFVMSLFDVLACISSDISVYMDKYRQRNSSHFLLSLLVCLFMLASVYVVWLRLQCFSMMFLAFISSICFSSPLIVFDCVNINSNKPFSCVYLMEISFVL
jgi:hypothetical protein